MFRRKRQVLFIQGGGAGAHDEWDVRLVDDLQRALGDEYEVRYPRRFPPERIETGRRGVSLWASPPPVRKLSVAVTLPQGVTCNR